MKQIILLTALMFFVGTSLSAQQAKDLIGKWHIIRMSSNGSEFKIEDKEKIMAVFMKESKAEELSKDSVFSEQDSLDAVKDNTSFINNIFDSQHNYLAGGIYRLDCWNENDAWKPITYNGKYTYNPSTKKLKVVADGKERNYTVSIIQQKMKLTVDAKSFFVLEKVK